MGTCPLRVLVRRVVKLSDATAGVGGMPFPTNRDGFNVGKTKADDITINKQSKFAHYEFN